MKKKTPYKKIQGILLSSRLVVIGVLAFSTIVCTAFAISSNKIHRRATQSSYAVAPNGQVLPLELMNRADNLEVEIKHHLDMFHKYFYGINSSNYRKSIEKALWLGDSSVDAVYQQKRADKVYNKLVQFNLFQEVENVNTKLSLEDGRIKFLTETTFRIKRGEQIDRFVVTTTGGVINNGISRDFPKNPHGMTITNFFEETFVKLLEE